MTKNSPGAYSTLVTLTTTKYQRKGVQYTVLTMHTTDNITYYYTNFWRKEVQCTVDNTIYYAYYR